MDELHVTIIREDIAALRKDTTDVLKGHDERLRAVEKDTAIAKSWGKAGLSLALTALAAVFAKAAGVV